MKLVSQPHGRQYIENAVLRRIFGHKRDEVTEG
jgi:hypothetical protein